MGLGFEPTSSAQDLVVGSGLLWVVACLPGVECERISPSSACRDRAEPDAATD